MGPTQQSVLQLPTRNSTRNSTSRCRRSRTPVCARGDIARLSCVLSAAKKARRQYATEDGCKDVVKVEDESRHDMDTVHVVRTLFLQLDDILPRRHHRPDHCPHRAYTHPPSTVDGDVEGAADGAVDKDAWTRLWLEMRGAFYCVLSWRWNFPALSNFCSSYTRDGGRRKEAVQ